MHILYIRGVVKYCIYKQISILQLHSFLKLKQKRKTRKQDIRVIEIRTNSTKLKKLTVLTYLACAKSFIIKIEADRDQ